MGGDPIPPEAGPHPGQVAAAIALRQHCAAATAWGSMMSATSLFFSAEGRIGRGAYWIGVLVLLFAGLLSTIPLLGLLVWLVLAYAWICLFSKRLHDMGRSGWLQVAPFLLGFLLLSAGVALLGVGVLTALIGNGGGLAGVAVGAGALALGSLLVGGLVHALFVIWLGLAPGQPGFNRYGPEPASPGAPL